MYKCARLDSAVFDAHHTDTFGLQPVHRLSQLFVSLDETGQSRKELRGWELLPVRVGEMQVSDKEFFVNR